MVVVVVGQGWWRGGVDGEMVSFRGVVGVARLFILDNWLGVIGLTALDRGC